MRSSTSKPLEVWFEPADSRRFAVLLTRLCVGVGAVALIGGLVVSLTVADRLRSTELAEDRALVDRLVEDLGVVGAVTPGRIDAGAGRILLIVDQGPPSNNGLREATIRTVPRSFSEGEGAAFQDEQMAWLDAVATSAAGDGGQLFRVDPAGDRWWVSTGRIDNDSVMVLLRPTSSIDAIVTWINRWLAGVGLAVVAALVVVWLTMRSKVLAASEKLIDAAEDLRVRGEFRSSTRAGLDQIAERPLEFKRLARSLDHIERDARSSLEQIESLLVAAQTLGASLDSAAVLENTLAHLETLLGIERSAILRFDARFESFRVLTSRGHTADFLDALRVRPADRDLPTVRCLAEQSPVQVPDTESVMVNERLKERARRYGYRSVLAVPLPGNLQNPSLLLVHKSSPYTYSHDEIELSISFASIAAAALRNAELFARTDESLRSQTSQLGAIIESVDQGILVSSGDGRVLFANTTMARMLDPADASGGSPGTDGLTLASAIEGVLRSATDREGARAALARMEAGIDGEADAWCDIDLVRRDALSTYRVRGFAVTADDGRSIGRGQVWTDVTEERVLDKMKSGLLATISHEFRTPLALIKGYATTLLADDVEWGSAERDEFLGLVSAEADRLTELVERLLDMRRIDAGMVELDLAPVDVPSLIEAALAGLPHRRNRIVLDGSPRIPVVAVDEARIVTVLRNLIENACRYSPSGEPVTVAWRPDGGETVITVADRGAGVPEAERERIFKTFVRSTSPEADGGAVGGGGIGGLGLGLAIARGFTEAHGGKIWVESGERGVGSRFGVRLPTEQKSATLPI